MEQEGRVRGPQEHVTRVTAHPSPQPMPPGSLSPTQHSCSEGVSCPCRPRRGIRHQLTGTPPDPAGPFPTS